MIRTLLLSALFATATPFVFAQATEEEVPPLAGKIEGDAYLAPTGTYKITIPVLPELGGDLEDTPNAVHFHDTVNTHASIACFPLDASQSWLLETKGKKEYLVEFFTRYVQTDFAQRYPGSKVESARYLPSLNEGSVLAYNLLPGGTMFPQRITLLEGDPIPVAKRGNLLFIKNNHLYILSIELAEKVIERSTYNKTTAEEDDILRKRLIGLLDKMTFLDPTKK